MRCRAAGSLAACAILAAALTCAPLTVDAGDASRLPDGEVTSSLGVTAYLTEPTTRYDHGVLGDAIEAGGFTVEAKGVRFHYRLGGDAVFEDRRVRLADIDGDDAPEAIIIKSDLKRGAAIAAFRILADRIVLLAESAPAGRPHRWLNIVGVANFLGDGKPTIAAVVTPHLAGSLRLYRLRGDALVEAARIDGFTNHIIGSRDQDLARIVDVNDDGVPEIVLPASDRRSLAVIAFRKGTVTVASRHPVARRIVKLISATKDNAIIEDEAGRRSTLLLK